MKGGDLGEVPNSRHIVPTDGIIIEFPRCRVNGDQFRGRRSLRAEVRPAQHGRRLHRGLYGVGTVALAWLELALD